MRIKSPNHLSGVASAQTLPPMSHLPALHIAGHYCASTGSETIARLWLPPAAMALTFPTVFSTIGAWRSEVVPSPSWPYSLLPQTATLPSLLSARLCTEPAAMALTPLRYDTCTGVLRMVVLRSPSWPSKLAPQARTVPSVFSARLCQLPAAIALTPLRRLYLEHRTAFDLVYAHRYTHQKRLRGTLIDLIEETPGITYGGKAGTPPEEWLIFYPDEWDVPALRCAREDYRTTGPILSFVFDNYLDSLDLKLEFGPGNERCRHRLLKMAHTDPDLFSVAPAYPDPEWVTIIWRLPFLTREEYLDGTDSHREDLVRRRWYAFLREVLPQLSAAIRRQEWIRNANAET